MRAVCWRIGLRRSDWVGNAAMAAAMALNAAGFYATLVFVLALLATGSILGPFVAIIWGVAGVVALAFLAASVAAAAYATSAARARRELTALESQYETLSEAFRRMAMNVRSTCCAGSYLEQDVALPTCG